jgi:sugar phosphate isomerase/epimerase
MLFLLSTGSLWSYSIERCFFLGKEAGYDGIELVVDHRWETRQASYLSQFVEKHQLPILAIHSPFMPHLPGWPADQPLRIELSVKLAEQLGAQVVVHHLPNRIGFAFLQSTKRRRFIPVPSNPEAGYRRWIENGYREFQSGTDVKLCIENMPALRKFGRRWSYSHWNTTSEISRFRYITIDTTHLGTWGLDPLKVYSELGEKVAHIHLSNYDGHEHQLPDNGQLQLDILLKRLSEDHYSGFVTLELYPEALHAGEPDDVVLTHLRNSLEFCHQSTEVD